MQIEQVIKMLKPENELELQLIQLPELYRGLLWGEPRFGHPEGKVLLHVLEIYGNINQLLHISDTLRRDLRIIALVHDAFKYQEDKGSPRNWNMHHGAIARRAVQHIIQDQDVLDIIELHDEAYYCWRGSRRLANDDIEPRFTLDTLLKRIQPFLITYMLFFRCDTLTGDKNPAPLKWFEDSIRSESGVGV
jgi:hypothetical protein